MEKKSIKGTKKKKSMKRYDDKIGLIENSNGQKIIKLN